MSTQVSPSLAKCAAPRQRGTSHHHQPVGEDAHIGEHQQWRKQYQLNRWTAAQSPDALSRGLMRTSTPKLRNTSVFRLATPKRNNPNHSSAVYPGRPSPGFYFPHLALAAFAAIFRRCSGVKAFALAFPPFSPPARRLDGCLFDSLTVSSASPMAISNLFGDLDGITRTFPFGDGHPSLSWTGD